MAKQRKANSGKQDNQQHNDYQVTVTIEGVCPLLQCANPDFLVPGDKRSKEQVKVDAAVEWRKKAYFSPEIGVYLPSDYIERSLQVAAGKWKLGKVATATVFCAEAEIPVVVSGVPQFTTLNDFEKHGWIDKRNAKLNKGAVGRSRPKLPTGWQATLSLMVTSAEIDSDLLYDMLEHAGKFVGLGDWRPKFGRFKVIEYTTTAVSA